MISRLDIAAIGGATEDVFLTVDDYLVLDNPSDLTRQKLLAFEYGGKVGISSLNRHFGGGSANVAVACARLGLKAACIGIVGADERGEAIKKNLSAHNVNVKAVRPGNGHSGVSYIVVTEAHEHVVFTYRGANSVLTVDRAAKKMLAQAQWTYITSLSGNWRTVLKEVFDSANLIVWNPGRLQLQAGFKTLASYLKKTAVLILNKDEAIELALSYPRLVAQKSYTSRQLATIISGFGPAAVVITDGARGAVASDGKHVYVRPAIKPKRILDTTGVGDAFGAGLIAGLHIHRGDMNKALELAAKNSASVVAHQGAQIGLLSR